MSCSTFNRFQNDVYNKGSGCVIHKSTICGRINYQILLQVLAKRNYCNFSKLFKSVLHCKSISSIWRWTAKLSTVTANRVANNAKPVAGAQICKSSFELFSQLPNKSNIRSGIIIGWLVDYVGICSELHARTKLHLKCADLLINSSLPCNFMFNTLICFEMSTKNAKSDNHAGFDKNSIWLLSNIILV